MNTRAKTALLIMLLAALLVCLRGKGRAATPTPAPIAIISPKSGEAVQGLVRVVGNTEIPNFKAAALFFGYAQDPTHTWFPLGKRNTPARQGLLARWDTTSITDGNYVLRLVVTTTDGKKYEVRVPVRVRNYTPIETPTPAPTPHAGATPPPPTPTATARPIYPTPTPIPTNAGTLTARQIGRATAYGAAFIALLILLFLLLQRR